jgi:hypothetical protein
VDNFSEEEGGMPGLVLSDDDFDNENVLNAGDDEESGDLSA